MPVIQSFCSSSVMYWLFCISWLGIWKFQLLAWAGNTNWAAAVWFVPVYFLSTARPLRRRSKY